ncbi:hydroxyacid dehydrogenase [Crossiella cryophila]|uniref:Phosphoglycerate dehydrogenase-like enzyme n=1 Tax=Crossiella cryophila TaxID=43355 RepID=A0A7W7FX82_9PSEU|nr:hydroxyacid dehydrogenase [Crossiella cryophila]MBB4680348.1 phosphoglycerate dehydrogenase-like enzyme [Crossiella cryophila]
MSRPRAVPAMSPEAAEAVLDPAALAAFAQVCDLVPDVVLAEFDSAAARAALAEAEVLIIGWGCPPLTAEVLAAAPRLRAVVHTGGTVRGYVTEACWERGIEVSSAAAANALPVAEYTVAMILLSGKKVLERAREYRASGEDPGRWLSTSRTLGNFGRTVGILSASLIGRRVIELLRPYDFRVLLHDPYVTDEQAGELGVEPVSLPELFARGEIVSVHTPLLPATRGLVSRELIDSMRQDAMLINTARGAVVDQEALAAAALAGRVRAVLDVTDPELLPKEHPLWHSENVLISPHLAGSQGNEWGRLAEHAAAEIARWSTGVGFAHPVRRERLDRLA